MPEPRLVCPFNSLCTHFRELPKYENDKWFSSVRYIFSVYKLKSHSRFCQWNSKPCWRKKTHTAFHLKFICYHVVLDVPFRLYHVSIPRWGLLESPGKMSNFENFSGVKSKSKFSTGETTKSSRDDMKMQRGELTKALDLLKNIYAWLTQKLINAK